jgi:ABC-type multidrug transport system ATPase subunit
MMIVRSEVRSVRLQIESVSKVYRGRVQALTDFSLDLSPGMYGLLGPNGAGKSTLMRIIATVTRPSAGRVVWNGKPVSADPNALRRVLGFLPQDFGVYPNLNPTEFLAYLAAAKGMDGPTARRRIDGLLDLVNLTEVRKRPLGGFSGGMRQRVGIAQSLLNDPELLVIDEPTAGLDPEERVRFRNLLAELAGERIVLLSTHIVSDVEAMASRIALIDSGRLIVESTPEGLLADVEDRVWAWDVPATDLQRIKDHYLVIGAVRRSDGVQVRVVAETVESAKARRVPSKLEDAYLYRLAVSRGSP